MKDEFQLKTMEGNRGFFTLGSAIIAALEYFKRTGSWFFVERTDLKIPVFALDPQGLPEMLTSAEKIGLQT